MTEGFPEYSDGYEDEKYEGEKYEGEKYEGEKYEKKYVEKYVYNGRGCITLGDLIKCLWYEVNPDFLGCKILIYDSEKGEYRHAELVMSEGDDILDDGHPVLLVE